MPPAPAIVPTNRPSPAAAAEPVPTAADNLRVDSILASVNGIPVSLLDVVDECNREEARLGMMYSGDKLKKEVRAVRRKVLDDIIDRKLIVEDYRNEPFEIPRQNIENMLDEMSSSFTDGTRKSLKKKISESGITLDDLEERMRDRIIVDFMIGNLFFKSVEVTPKEVFDYYQKHVAGFAEPSQIRLEVLYLPQDREKLDQVVKDIANDLKTVNDKIFRSLVMLHSAAPNAKSGGDLGWIEQSKLRPEFAAAVEKQPSGFISGPVQTPEGIYFLRICELNKGGIKPFELVKKDITEKLRRDGRELAYKEYIAGLRKDALIRYYID